MDDRQAFLTGVQRGLDPQPVGDVVGTDGRAVTSPSSLWNHWRCRSCGHSFRRGDAVLVTGTTPDDVVHADPVLDRRAPGQAAGHGGDDAPGDTPASRPGAAASDAVAFSSGLLHAFPVAGGIPVHLVDPADWRVPRSAEDPSPTCLYCGHTFRAGEYIVVCPCRPDKPRCGSAVHRDPAAGLSCWETWRPDSSLNVCPVTLSRVGGQSG
jgi:hypothetical protein